jgi:hypothetical protein
MSRRIEIEITSLNGEQATWRAAGAKLPKGVLDASLVPGGPVIGTVYRADIEQYMEGIEVLAVLPAKTASPLDPRHERVELIPNAKTGPDVVVTYAPKGRGARRDFERDGEHREGSKRPGGRSGPKERSTSARPERGPRPDRPDRPVRPDRPDRAPRPPRVEGANPSEGRERPARTERPARGEQGSRPERGGRPARPGRTPHGPPGAPPMTTTYRNALLATLSPEQLPVAEQLLRGGMPAVRTAVADQNKNAAAQGRATVDAATIERIAEDLLARTNLALWKDKAAGALGAGRELRLRDLRAVVTAAKTVSLDDEAKVQQKELHANLTARLEVLRTQWNERLEAAVTSKNVAEALRLVARPPDMSTRVSAEMAAKVITITSEALTADQEPAKWQEIVTLAIDTSIRRNVKPQGIPADDASKALAIHNAGAIPEFAKLLGMKVPPPPPPQRNVRRAVTRRAS